MRKKVEFHTLKGQILREAYVGKYSTWGSTNEALFLTSVSGNAWVLTHEQD